MPRQPNEIKIQRAREIIGNHPGWGKVRVNRQLINEFGHGLRYSNLLKLKSTILSKRAADAPLLPPTDKITFQSQRQTLKDAGFIPSEIGRRFAGLPAGWKSIGDVLASGQHATQFRPVLQRLIDERWLEYQKHLQEADRYGWSAKTTAAKWSAKVLRHYRRGDFTIQSDPRKPVLRPSPTGGGLVTADGHISPWGLYHAMLAYLRSIDPYGGLGFDSPTSHGAGKPKAMRVRTKRTIREHIRDEQTGVSQLEASMARASQAGDYAKVRQFASSRQAKLNSIEKLNNELRQATK